MKIKRKINDVEFTIELLPEELYDAYREQQHKLDIESVINYGEMFDPEDMQEEFGCSYDEFLSIKEDIAEELRRNIDKYDVSFDYAIKTQHAMWLLHLKKSQYENCQQYFLKQE